MGGGWRPAALAAILLPARRLADRNGPATRRAILGRLRDDPGLTKSQVCRSLGLAWGTVSHHVRILEREQALVRRTVLGFSRLYAAGSRGPEASLLPLLRETIVPRLLQRIGSNPGVGIQALSREMALGRKVVRRKLEAMVELGLLERSPDYRPKFFVLDKGRRLAEGPPDDAPGGEGPAEPGAPAAEVPLLRA